MRRGSGQSEGFTRSWPKAIAMDAATIARVDALWPALGLGQRPGRSAPLTARDGQHALRAVALGRVRQSREAAAHRLSASVRAGWRDACHAQSAHDHPRRRSPQSSSRSRRRASPPCQDSIGSSIANSTRTASLDRRRGPQRGARGVGEARVAVGIVRGHLRGCGLVAFAPVCGWSRHSRSGGSFFTATRSGSRAGRTSSSVWRSPSRRSAATSPSPASGAGRGGCAILRSAARRCGMERWVRHPLRTPGHRIR